MRTESACKTCESHPSHSICHTLRLAYQNDTGLPSREHIRVPMIVWDLPKTHPPSLRTDSHQHSQNRCRAFDNAHSDARRSQIPESSKPLEKRFYGDRKSVV